MEPVAYQKSLEYEKDYWWFVGRRNLVFEFLKRYSPQQGVLVDVGSGTGCTLERTCGFKMKVGIEKAGGFMGRLQGDPKIFQICADALHLPVADARADCVLALDVVEHLDEDLAGLLEIFRICKPGGLLLMTVPAFQFLWSGEDKVSRHKRRYDAGQVRAVLETAGFRILKISYFNFILLPLVLAVILIKRFLGRKVAGQSNLFRLPGVLNGILLEVLNLERILLRRVNFPAGSSIICVAEKGSPLL